MYMQSNQIEKLYDLLFSYQNIYPIKIAEIIESLSNGYGMQYKTYSNLRHNKRNYYTTLQCLKYLDRKNVTYIIDYVK